MGDLSLVIISFLYIGLVILLSSLVLKKTRDSEISRKFVHVMVGNWILLTPFFDSLAMALLVPLAFIIINTLSVRRNIIPSMERKGNERNYGTVMYAASLFLMTLLGYSLKMWTIQLIGILIMAYGDGLAALIGKEYGSNRFRGTSKSLEGSLVVFACGFIITLLIGSIARSTEGLEGLDNLGLVLISLSTGILASLAEFVGRDGYDNISLPVLSGIFASLLIYFPTRGQLVALCFALLILLVAYFNRSISLDGLLAALVTAQVLYVYGGPYLYLSLIVFFVLGSFISKIKNKEKARVKEGTNEKKAGRNFVQVICNSLPAVILALASDILAKPDLLILAFGVFSVAAADTFSSELGTLSSGRVVNILTGRRVPKGLSGGVSLAGLGAGVLGSLILALFALANFSTRGFLIAFILGVLGTIFDSILGILFQRKFKGKKGRLQDYPENPTDKPVRGLSFVNNNMVNFLTTSLVPLLGLLII